MLALFFWDFPQSFFSERYFIPSQLWWSINGLILKTISGYLQIASRFKKTVAAYWKYLSSLFLGLLLFFSSFFIQSAKSMYQLLRLKFTLWHLKCIKLTPSKIKLLPFFDDSNSTWYLEKNDSKIYSITSFAFS